MQDENRQPLRRLAAIPEDPPKLVVQQREIDYFSMNWESQTGNRLIQNAGKLPSQEVEIQPGKLQLELSAAEIPLALTVSVYVGTLNEIDPSGDPQMQLDCVTSAHCSIEQTHSALLVGVPLEQPYQQIVVSVFAEYYRNPELFSREGATNLVMWAFNAHAVQPPSHSSEENERSRNR